jgi:hypothetical protein
MSQRKGISTFIATLLLMVLAVSAGVVIYAYTMGYLGGFGGTEQLGAMSIDESSAFAGDNITAYVRNIGKTTISIDTAYVDGENSTIEQALTGLEEGEVGVIVVEALNTVAGKTYEVKLIATDNTQVSFSVKAN